jgi:tetratricopeptide (TPR) repeat protein
MTGATQAQTQVSVSSGNGLAHYCYMSAYASFYNKREAENGISTCSAALEGSLSVKDRAATLNNRGILYDVKADYSDAWDDFNMSIKFDGNLGDAWLNRGVARIRLKQLEDAVIDINKGISLGTSMPQFAYYDLGVAEENQGKLTEAYRDFQRSLAADPNFKPSSDALKNFVVAREPVSSQGGRDSSSAQ